MPRLYVRCGMENCHANAVATVAGRMLYPIAGCTVHILGWLNNIEPIVRVASLQETPRGPWWP